MKAARQRQGTVTLADGRMALRLSQWCSPRFLYPFVLVVTYLVVASATFQGFYGKFTFYDGHVGQSVASTLDGTGERPYVYRQLLPQFANLIERLLPESAVRAAEARLLWARGGLTSPKGSDATKEGYVLRYRIVYYATFLCLLLSLFVLRSICISAGLDRVSASIAPAMFTLTVPILQTNGGYYYDLPELLAFALAARLAIAGQILPLVLLAAPAAANKESFFFYCVTLLPLLRHRLSLNASLLGIAAALLVSGLCYVFIRYSYMENPGSPTIFQLPENLAFYLNPLNLLKMDQSYGLPLFKAYGVVMLGWFAAMMAYGWTVAPAYIRQHLALAAAINVPLFLLFCAAGEMRNLSMLYVGTVVLMAGALHRWIATELKPTAAG